MPSLVKMDFPVADFPSLLCLLDGRMEAQEPSYERQANAMHAHFVRNTFLESVTKRDLVEADIMGVRRPTFFAAIGRKRVDF